MYDDLSGEALQREIDRAKAVNSVAHTIIKNAGTQIEAMKLREAIIENNGKGELPEMLIPKDTSSGRRLIEAQNEILD